MASVSENLEEGKKVLILGASSDIGKALMHFYLEQGHQVLGTYRNSKSLEDFPKHPRASFLHCDVGNSESIRMTAEKIGESMFHWDILVSGVGTEEPIGNFLECDFNEWEQSVIVNSTAQLRFLHAVYPFRNAGKAEKTGKICHVVFFAGGGTNNAFPRYSAYCVSKILLIKMCESLDAEAKDLNTFIVGPGWVRTKIHQQTVNNPAGAGSNYRKTLEFLESGEQGTPYEEIFDCIDWCIRGGRDVAGGRNFSVVHDPWKENGDPLAARLVSDPDKFKLRRYGNEDLGLRPELEKMK